MAVVMAVVVTMVLVWAWGRLEPLLCEQAKRCGSWSRLVVARRRFSGRAACCRAGQHLIPCTDFGWLTLIRRGGGIAGIICTAGDRAGKEAAVGVPACQVCSKHAGLAYRLPGSSPAKTRRMRAHPRSRVRKREATWGCLHTGSTGEGLGVSLASLPLPVQRSTAGDRS